MTSTPVDRPLADDFALWEAEVTPSAIRRWAAAARRALLDGLICVGWFYCPVIAPMSGLERRSSRGHR